MEPLNSQGDISMFVSQVCSSLLAILREKSLTFQYGLKVVPFPSPLQSSLQIVAEYYQTGLAYFASLGKTFTPSFTMLEGYINGRLITDTLRQIRLK